MFVYMIVLMISVECQASSATQGVAVVGLGCDRAVTPILLHGVLYSIFKTTLIDLAAIRALV
jgi:hypothetical protein